MEKEKASLFGSTSAEYRQIIIENSGRLDLILASQLLDLSRSRIQALIRAGECWVNDTRAIKTGVAVIPGDIIKLHLPNPIPVQILPQEIALDVVFEDENVLIINKPAGMVVHPSAGHANGTIVNAALAHTPFLQGINGEQRPGIVHRLDKNTSGILVIAKNDVSHRWLQAQFKNRDVVKIYLALVDGFPLTESGRIEASIQRDPRNRQRMAIAPEGKGRTALTEFKVLQKFHKHTLMEVHLLTGRTHQIRVHLAALKIPVAGDTVYGRINPSIHVGRHFLHAKQLTLRLPGQKVARTFTAPLPQELEKVLQELRK